MAKAGENNMDYFFEGAEKLCEVWFASSDGKGDLRKMERSRWEELLCLVNAEIISERRDENMIAYVLSESSMFISRNRFILKTCGTTTLLKAVQPLIEMAKECCGMDKVVDVFYSRKNFLRPELQSNIHSNFNNEVDYLDDYFDGGAAYAMGRMNGKCWYMYTMERGNIKEPDQTLELIMQDLDPNVMNIFSKEYAMDGVDATQKSGIDRIIPGAKIDEFLFDPCGYSMNAIIPNETTGCKTKYISPQGHYFTIHITPEPEFSYVSFETNVPQDTYKDLIMRVLNIFKPRHFMMTLFANKKSLAIMEHRNLENLEAIDGFTRVDHQYSQFKNYSLTYANYERPQAMRRPAGYI